MTVHKTHSGAHARTRIGLECSQITLNASGNVTVHAKHYCSWVTGHRLWTPFCYLRLWAVIDYQFRVKFDYPESLKLQVDLRQGFRKNYKYNVDKAREISLLSVLVKQPLCSTTYLLKWAASSATGVAPCFMVSELLSSTR